MSDNITIAVNDTSVQNLLQQLKAKASNLKPVMQIIGEILRTSVDENFQQNGRYSTSGSWLGGSNKWEPLKPGTIKAKRKGRNPANILRDTGRLVSSITAKAEKDRVKIGTNVVYAAIHQFGGTITSKPQKKTLRFRKTRSGALMTQGETGKLANLLVFAGKKHKNTFNWEVTTRGHQITIPARPFLVVQDDDMDQIRNNIISYIAEISKP